MIGLGNMGGRIARRIRDGGLPIRGFDVSEEQAGSAGVETEKSIAALAAAVDVVFLSLPDSRVIESVVFDDGGLVSALRDGQIVVDLSTAAPSSSARIHDQLAGQGVAFLDAGISGGAAAAEKGALTLMVGGDANALEQVQPILETFSTGVHHMGAPGSGHTAKVLNNFLNGVSLAATAEVMVAAKRAQLDLAQFLEVVNASSGVNFATLNRFPRIIEGDYLEGGLTNQLMAKDIRLYLELLQEMSVTSFCGPACLGAFNLATALGYGDQISNRVVDAIGDVAGGVRIQA
jgi:3-hydroxyisobutyrate dehydrogenase-like beta-hydroxyacid dehydrogenase